jgi:hypothetical protein
MPFRGPIRPTLEQGLLLEHTGDFVFEHDPAGTKTHVSPVMEQAALRGRRPPRVATRRPPRRGRVRRFLADRGRGSFSPVRETAEVER